MKFKVFIRLGILLVAFMFFVVPANAANLSERLKGRILLQVEQNGEAWYVGLDERRYFMGRPVDAFELMRKQGIGITNFDLGKIEIGVLEECLVLDRCPTPGAPGVGHLNAEFSISNKGEIFLQVEENGEAWYVDPVDAKRYYLGRPVDAFFVMRSLGLGITNEDLEKIPVADSLLLSNLLEKSIFYKINEKRVEEGLKGLEWSEKITAVAREHSQNLAIENNTFAVSMGKKCDLSIIHHQGFDFGLYQDSRLKNRGFFNFNFSGENIAMAPLAQPTVWYQEGDGTLERLKECEKMSKEMDSIFKEKIYSDMSDEAKIELIETEIKNRTEIYDNYQEFEKVVVEEGSENEAVDVMVEGWMNSPGHRENILSPEFNETGIGVVNTDGGYLIATQVFIRRVECGFEMGACCKKDGYYPYCFEGLECNNEICENVN